MSVKNLLFLLAVVFFAQCKLADSAAKNAECGDFVTQKVVLPGQSKSGSVSYVACEYVVIMPQSKDSFELIAFMKERNYVRARVSEANSSVQLYRPTGTDTNPKPKPMPAPIIDRRVQPNVLVIDGLREPRTLFDVLNSAPTNAVNRR